MREASTETAGASRASTSNRTGGSGGSASTASGLRQSLCAFWLGARCFGVDVAMVGEVVVVAATTPVPKAHHALLGLFNLRGTPVPLVDAAAILDLAGERPRGETHALVLRRDDLVVALAIDRMEAVVEAGRGTFTAPDGANEHPVVHGFLEIDDRVVTVIAPEVLLQRLARLRPNDDGATAPRTGIPEGR